MSYSAEEVAAGRPSRLGAMVWIPDCGCRPRRDLTGGLLYGLAIPPAPACPTCCASYRQATALKEAEAMASEKAETVWGRVQETLGETPGIDPRGGLRSTVRHVLETALDAVEASPVLASAILDLAIIYAADCRKGSP